LNQSNKFSPEARERAVGMAQENHGECPSLWATVDSMAPKTLLGSVKQAQVDVGDRPGVGPAEAQRVKEA